MRSFIHLILLLACYGLVAVAVAPDASQSIVEPLEGNLSRTAPGTTLISSTKQSLFSLLRPKKTQDGRKHRKRDLECRLVHKYKDKCKFVHENCADEEVGLFDYLDLYYCKFGAVKVVPFMVMALWLGTLFMTIGIAASDFFCVNLSTIANILGMSESMAGVTFLAFGNGSPDVFSTFAAMKINSGSLAVGELIGAASFITAVVAGSMALVRPFKVAKKSFVRDVIFFTVAVCFSIYFLWDGKITLWESIVMVCFYGFYVLFVVAWHWYQKRAKSRRSVETRARDHYTDLGNEEPEEEDEDGDVASANERTRLVLDTSFLDLEHAGEQDDEFDTEADESETETRFAELNSNMRISRPSAHRSFTPMTPIRPSLVGALEFRAVLASLERDRNLPGRPIHLRSYSDDPFFSTMSAPHTMARNTGGNTSPVARRPSLQPPHGQRNLLPPGDVRGRVRAVSVGDATNPSNDPSLHRASMEPSQASILEEPPLIDIEGPTPRTPRFNEHFDFDEDAPTIADSQTLLAPPDPHGTTSPGTRSPSLPSTPLLLASPDSSRASSRAPSVHFTASPAPMSPVMTTNGHRASVPSISLPDSSLSSAMYPLSPEERPVRWWPYAILPPPRVLFLTLFPTLRGFREKSLLQKVLGIIAAPSVMLLTITLPVVEYTEPEPDPDKDPRASHPPSPTSTMVSESAMNRNPEWANDESLRSRPWNRWLTAVQCITAPVFIVLVTVAGTMSLLKPVLIGLLIGMVSLLLLLLFTTPDRPPKYKYMFCFVGFVVSIGWISTVAGEVVGVLKAFGVILGISDAILGLTIFAVGNSLGDLVADITVARLGFPVMALSACFGGPMLNILLGIGISGLYVTLTKQPNLPSDGFHIEVSSTLMISAITLLGTLLFLLVSVPMNNWRMTKRIGAGLVVIWTASTITNVVVEVIGKGAAA